MDLSLPECLHLYTEPSEKTLKIQTLAQYLKEKFPKTKIDCRKEFFNYWLRQVTALAGSPKKIDQVAEKLARCRISDLQSQELVFSPLPLEIEYEKKNILNLENRKFGLVYDGLCLQEVYREIIPQEERKSNHLQIVFTNQLLATWEEDGRYHLRVGIYGVPNLISTSGIVEAPAKPKEYYLLKSLGETAIADWKEKNKEKFIDYNDPRLTEVLKGYLMQAIFYHLTGDPFCKNKNCRLYNAHWQEELIKAQLNKKREFCEFHEKILVSLK